MYTAVARAIARCGGHGGERQMLRHRGRLPITCGILWLEVIIRRREVVAAAHGCARIGGIRQRARLAHVALAARIARIAITRTRRIFAGRSVFFLHAWRILPASLGAILAHHTAASIWRHRQQRASPAPLAR